MSRETVKDEVIPYKFEPKTPYPGHEYIQYFKWYSKYMRKFYHDGLAVEHANNVLGRLDTFWLGAVDAVVCNDLEVLSKMDPNVVEQAKHIAEHPTGDYEDIYENFAKKYSLGKYRYTTDKGT